MLTQKVRAKLGRAESKLGRAKLLLSLRIARHGRLSGSFALPKDFLSNMAKRRNGYNKRVGWPGLLNPGAAIA